MPDSPTPDSPDTPASTPAEPAIQSNPFYGCAILIIVVLTFGFIIGWTIYSGVQQNKEIGAFTVPDPAPLPENKPTDGQKATLKMKLNTFAEVANNGKPVALALTLEDLNTLLAVAGETGVADYRGMVWFTGIDASAKMLKADIVWKMNNMPFVEAPDRFLAGHATFKPVIENGALELHIETLEVPGKTVSEGFMRQLRNWPWLNLAKLKDEVRNPLSKVTGFDFTADNSIFSLHCGNTAQP